MHASHWLHNRIHFSIYEAKGWRNGRKNDRNRYALLTLSNSHAVACFPEYHIFIFGRSRINDTKQILHLFWKCDKNTCNSSLTVSVLVLSKPTVYTWFRAILGTKVEFLQPNCMFFLPGYKTTAPVWLSRVLLFIHVYIAFFSRSLFHFATFYFRCCATRHPSTLCHVKRSSIIIPSNDYAWCLCTHEIHTKIHQIYKFDYVSKRVCVSVLMLAMHTACVLVYSFIARNVQTYTMLSSENMRQWECNANAVRHSTTLVSLTKSLIATPHGMTAFT